MLQQIADYLAGLPAIHELVGERVYARRAFRTTQLPRITIDQVEERFAHTMAGPDAIRRPRIQVDVWGTDPDDVDTIAQRVLAILDGYRGDIGGITMQGIFADGQRNGTERRSTATEELIHRVTIDFEVRATKD